MTSETISLKLCPTQASTSDRDSVSALTQTETRTQCWPLVLQPEGSRVSPSSSGPSESARTFKLTLAREGPGLLVPAAARHDTVTDHRPGDRDSLLELESAPIQLSAAAAPPGTQAVVHPVA